MKLFSDWGFNPNSWQGQRGEYWLLAQILLILAFPLLPNYRPPGLILSSTGQYGLWIGTALLGVAALVLLAKGVLDLGRNLTPLPHPRDDGQLVQTGIYSVVRHPLYGGLVLAALSWALFQLSFSHLVATLVLFLFLNAKASREEFWLLQKHPEYADYQQRVKKMLPWLY